MFSKQAKTAPKKPGESEVKVSSKKNLLIPIFGILVMVGVFGVLNSQWLSAQAINKFQLQTSNQFIETGSIVASQAENTSPTIIIPKINVNAPLIDDVKTHNESEVQLGLRRGILKYWKTANPGEAGNTVLFGHSSGQIWTPGDYKFVFTLLDDLVENDRIYVDYSDVRYVYLVTSKKVVEPNDFSIVQPTSFPQLTLVTCTPVGTSKNRLVVQAKQIIPNPANAKPTLPGSVQPINSTKPLPR